MEARRCALDEIVARQCVVDEERQEADRRKRAEPARRAGSDPYFLVLFAFAVAFSAFATE